MIPVLVAAAVKLPSFIISVGMLIVGVPLMMGALEWGLIPIILVREAVRDGFPKGLGPLSEDYGVGIIVSPEGETIGMYLAMLTQHFEELEWIQNKVFHVKVAEAREIFDLTEALDASGNMDILVKLETLEPQERKKHVHEEEWTKHKLSVAIIPLVKYLKKFPTNRTSTLPTAAKAA